MCRPADPLCLMVPTLESLGNALPYRPLPVAVVDSLMGRAAPRLPDHLTRALFLSKHNNKVSHLPIYDATEAYEHKMRDAPFGTHAYQINMMFLPRPKGDGTDGDVCFFADVDADGQRLTIEQRSMTLSRGQSVTVNLPGESQGPAVLTTSRGVYRVHVTQAGPRPRPETGPPAAAKMRLYPSLTVEPAGADATEWHVRPDGPGALSYRLMARRRGERGEAHDWEVRAAYHHAGAHLEHPVDSSEGVLLLPAVEDAQGDMTAVALVLVLLWHIRDLGVQERPNHRFSKILRKWHVRK